MRKLGLILMLAAMTALAVIGCGTDDPKPAITKLYASSTCGTVPMRVDFRADATGGTAFPEPTGGNNWLQMTWDFGDGTVIQDGTSIAYHFYSEPDTYTVTVTATDDNGDTATRSREIIAYADSLAVFAYGAVDSQLVEEVPACRPLELGALVETCGFDPVNDSYERFLYRWIVGDSVYTSPNPRHTFESTELGLQEIHLVLQDPTRSITRFDTVMVDVLASNGADVSLSADWLASPGGPDSEVFDRDVASFPDTLTYTVHLLNDGPDDAYNVDVIGTLPSNNRLIYYDAAFSSGSLVYRERIDGNLAKEWTWNVPLVAAGGEESVDITFYLEMSSTGASFDFDTLIDGYACDPDDDDHEVTATLNIASVPPPGP
jgi:uncharacterized repeat protein (TIGR01451 family)